MKPNTLVRWIGLALVVAVARPAAAAITITVGDATASAGGSATFTVSLDGVAAGGVQANNAQVDVIFDTAVLTVPANPSTACVIDARLASLTHTETLPANPPLPAGMRRLRLNVIDTGAVLGLVTDGTLYTCTFQVEATAPAGPSTLQATRQNVGDTTGNVLTSSTVNGTVTIGGGAPSPTPTFPSGIVIAVSSGNAAKGDNAVFTVTLSGVAAGGVQANNAQVDIIFDTAVFDVPANPSTACVIDPRLASLTHTETLPANPPLPAGMRRLRLNVIDTGAVLGLVTDGTLYTCTFAVNAAAPSGATTLQATRQNVGDTTGNVLTSSTVNGTITVGGVTPPTDTPTNTPPVPTNTPTNTPPTVLATNTPTRTNTPVTPPSSTPTRTNTPGTGATPVEDEDGCQIGTQTAGGNVWLLLLPLAGVLVMRRRRR